MDDGSGFSISSVDIYLLLLQTSSKPPQLQPVVVTCLLRVRVLDILGRILVGTWTGSGWMMGHTRSLYAELATVYKATRKDDQHRLNLN